MENRPLLTRCYGIALAMLCACSSSESNHEGAETITFVDAGPYARVDEAEFAKAWGQAEREHVLRCCESIGRSSTRRARDYERKTPSKGLARYNAAAAAACVAQREAAACALQKDAARLPASCLEAYVDGRVEESEPCQTSWECASTPDRPLECTSGLNVQGQLEHRCKFVPDGSTRAGSECNADDATSCPPPLRCLERTCRLPQLGEECLTGAIYADTCAIGSVCDRLDTRRCIEPTPEGSACTEAEACESYACVDGVCVRPIAGLLDCDVP